MSFCLFVCLSAVFHMCLFAYVYVLVFVNVLALRLKNKKMIGIEHVLEKIEVGIVGERGS